MTGDLKERFASVSAAPYIRSYSAGIGSADSVCGMTLRVAFALIPACVWGIYSFGARAAAMLLICTLSAVLFEWLFWSLVRRQVCAPDLSAAVTGLLIGMTTSAAAPLYIGVAGSFFAIVIVKGIFGGNGRNIVNPAIAAKVFTMLAWPGGTDIFQRSGVRINSLALSLSESELASVSGNAPLAALKSGMLPDDASVFDLIVGNCAGCIGEISAVLLIVGGIYLMATGVIHIYIPVSFLATVALVTFAFPMEGFEPVSFMLCQVFSGGVILAAIFMATDPVTSPVTDVGQIIYGVGCGILTVLIRYYAAYPDGFAFAILIMNLFAGFLDRAVTPTYRRVKS